MAIGALRMTGIWTLRNPSLSLPTRLVTYFANIQSSTYTIIRHRPCSWNVSASCLQAGKSVWQRPFWKLTCIYTTQHRRRFSAIVSRRNSIRTSSPDSTRLSITGQSPKSRTRYLLSTTYFETTSTSLFMTIRLWLPC